MPEDKERRVPTSKELAGGTHSGDDEGSAKKPKGRRRFLSRFRIRKGAGEARTEAAVPEPGVAKARAHPVELPEDVDPDALVPDEDGLELPDVVSEPAPIKSREKRRRGFKPSHLERDPDDEPMVSDHPTWWPTNGNVAKKLEAAMGKGHEFGGVRDENGTLIWDCIGCGRDIRLVFEQAARYRPGIGTTVIKADMVAWSCRVT